jgi:hypothetical protein
MKIDEIIRNPYYLVAGILLALISLIIMGSALAIGGCSKYPTEAVEQGFIGYPFQTGWNDPGLEHVGGGLTEFVAQDGFVGCFDTKKGSIDVVYEDSSIPCEPLPLCITQGYLDNYWVTVKVTGGYEPLNGSGYLTLCQKFEEVGKIDIVWYKDQHVDCVGMCPYADYWTAKFVLHDGEIELDSNQYPDGASHCKDYVTIPGKQVCVSYDTLWQGCIEIKQRFELI